MDVAFVGLGRMGMGMARRLIRAGHAVSGYDRGEPARMELAEAGGSPASGLPELVSTQRSPRLIWLMIPAGGPVDKTLDALIPLLAPGDIVVDGGNSFYRDSQRRAALLSQHGVRYLDCGTSGGVWGEENGYTLMSGGPREAFDAAAPILRSLAPNDAGFAHVGPAGAGHFCKMVHNGIEYGLMQAYGEGYEILERSEFGFDLARVSALWQQGSVVRSWLNELCARAFAEDPRLAELSDWVDDSGEGRWTVLAAMEEDVPAPVITLALQARFRSRQEQSFSAKVVAALRKGFGGHAVRPSEENVR